MSFVRPRVIFRADGDARMGLGHVVRCLALADMLQPDFETIFVIRQPGENVQSQIEQSCLQTWLVPEGLNETQEIAWLRQQLTPTDIVVLDGYHFSPRYAQTLWLQGQPVVCLDDLVNHYIWADLIINQAGGIQPEAYRHVPGAQLCLGPAYALLRRPFQEATRTAVTQPDTQRIFLNMGGADPENHTLALLQQMQLLFPAKAVDVVTGAAYPHQASLQQYAQNQDQVRLHHALPAEQMAALLQSCGIHVCPPSGMAYECCAVGGLLFLHPIADNQRQLLNFLTETGLAFPYSTLAQLPEPELAALALAGRQRQRQVFDGQAAYRFQRAFSELYAASQLGVRRARTEDAQQYFTWANDPEVRRNAIHSAPIEWPTHLQWFTRRLTDPDSFLYIFEREGTAVGQVRIEFSDSVGTIDYSVATAYRGRGLGVALLRRALGQLRRDKPGQWALEGQVKASNLPSCRVFQRLGFAQLAAVQLHNDTYEVFRLAVASADFS
ncbi:UDP-2,4-diacetamido-2,4,6-trideoxy-beta-L-altropyranose hydrolase [Hymenobacter cellulosilyticus]|uniref:UDP-2,4-diacetamido-2,4, 6-trideoxy-beta-L-altropyranose hydrolase n=1 Tax=Hymenobacter cellulosilyticus TaxID=2932248 RepID=A0A8T9PY78_9BACT|nr:UDP-2,4-diacetamido-2,4,6-trideoxy-beta-L-altropyranose hydrolase [Hymenobacter cellulosilyticus]UOQ70366.1 UDP-2,4-diacetamido-2,4,6-trideoxy-beta-L-altropyranose hydrolase [Hymenobacter cellulosilyticus]